MCVCVCVCVPEGSWGLWLWNHQLLDIRGSILQAVLIFYLEFIKNTKLYSI